MFDADGNLFSLDLDEQVGRGWNTVAAVGPAGDLVLAGFGPDDDIVVRRLGADRTELWTHYEVGSVGQTALGVAAGPGEAMAIAGKDWLDGSNALVRRHDGGGSIAWTSVFASTIRRHGRSY